jgi:hypothetical protein
LKFASLGAPTPRTIPAKILEQVRNVKGPVPGIKRTFSIGLDADKTDDLTEDLDELDLSSKKDDNPLREAARQRANQKQPSLSPKIAETHQASTMTKRKTRMTLTVAVPIRSSLESLCRARLLERTLMFNGMTWLDWMLRKKSFKKL